jgi:hypothetical protein
MSSSTQKQQQSQPPEIVLCGKCGDKPKKGVTFKTCSGCALVAYCSAACQLAAWSDHKAACKRNRAAKTARDEALKEKTKATAAPARGNSSGTSAGQQQRQQRLGRHGVLGLYGRVLLIQTRMTKMEETSPSSLSGELETPSSGRGGVRRELGPP